MMIITEARYRFTVARVRLPASQYRVFRTQELTPCVIRVSFVNISTLHISRIYLKPFSLFDVSSVLLVMSICLSSDDVGGPPRHYNHFLPQWKQDRSHQALTAS